VRQNSSLRGDFRGEEPTEAGNGRPFGCTVGTILVVVGAAKAFWTEALSLIGCLIVGVGVMLLLLGIFAPSRLSGINRIWPIVGTVIRKVVNPIVLAFLFFLVVTPMALLMRIVGKRPLRLEPNPAASSYWIAREQTVGAISSMRRQF